MIREAPGEPSKEELIAPIAAQAAGASGMMPAQSGGAG
jgi:hypothetical protein